MSKSIFAKDKLQKLLVHLQIDTTKFLINTIVTKIKNIPWYLLRISNLNEWTQSIGDTDCEHTIDIDKERTTKQNRTFSGKDSHCTHCLCSHPSIANCHTDATCYFLPPKESESEKIKTCQSKGRT